MKSFLAALASKLILHVLGIFIGGAILWGLVSYVGGMFGIELNSFGSGKSGNPVNGLSQSLISPEAESGIRTLITDYAGKLLKEKMQNGNVSEEVLKNHTSEFINSLSGVMVPKQDATVWGFEIIKAPSPYEGAAGHDLGIRFISSKGDVVTPVFTDPYRIGFMKNLGINGDGKTRRFTMDFAENSDYRDYLVDMKGDGDNRHLIVCNYEGGSSAAQYQAFLIDVRDNFKILKEIPAGECPDYPARNPELIF